jgi:hypothetical protein
VKAAKICPNCRKTFERNPNEAPNKFRVRRHCSAKCGRPRGETVLRATLTRKEVLAIRASSETPTVLAERYGVTASNISNIRARRTWAWLED